MIKKLLTFFILISFESFSQNPPVKIWDKDLGGLSFENLITLIQTADGGYLLGGYSYSGAGGDKTQASRGGYDYWIVKTDAFGVKQWDKDFGGDDFEVFTTVLQTSDHGFLLAGYTYSGISGDKTGPSKGLYDWWIVKTDSIGNFLWDKDFGTSLNDYLNSATETSDGGFLLGGYTSAGIDGDKSQIGKGLYDYWIIKTDAAGNKLWDKDFGGGLSDALYSVTSTSDGGFIIGGNSYSNVGGDKSQNTNGSGDYWLIRIDSMGNKLWDKDFGGTDYDGMVQVVQTADGGFAVGGSSISGIGGDKTQPGWGFNDYWMVKTDAAGNLEWDKDFGGTLAEDEYGSIVQTADHGYLLAGTSYSNISGDKSENNLGGEQTWLVKTDSLGNLQWDRTLLTNGHDEIGLAIETYDGCIVAGNFDNGAFGGDKSQSSWLGTTDYWVIKLCDSSATPAANFIAAQNLCPGTCASFVNLSTNANFFQWSFPGATPSFSNDVSPSTICYSIPGTYDVTLIAGNGTSADTLVMTNFITVYPFPPPQGITQQGDTLYSISGAVSYQWFLNSIPVPGATNYFYVAPQSGDYNVVATDANGCEVEAVIYNVLAQVDELSEMPFTISPNPVTDRCKIHFSKDANDKGRLDPSDLEISVYDMPGNSVGAMPLIRQGKKVSPEIDLDVSSLADGIYVIEISGMENIIRRKFIKSNIH